MSRTLFFIIRLVVAIVVLCVVLRFLGITWNDVDYFLDNGMLRAWKFLQQLQGIAHAAG